ncbi:MAG: hypothetical protein DRP45_07970 [Candidatus Zixiibacteriota bacterium]|nr:MAG: hypothetical protein DRP45_07970 [candidate division Zixibacteria bacterium]
MGYVAAAMAVIGGVSSILGARSAKEDARLAANEEARLEGIVTDSKVTGLQAEQRQLRGETISRAAGSGVNTQVGSPLQLLAEQAREFGREIRTVKQAGATRAAQAQTRGAMVGNQAMYQGFGQAASSMSNAFSLFAQAKGP